jgi:hypothetical protein
MRVVIARWVACLGLVCSQSTLVDASPAHARYREAVQLVNAGNPDQALAVIDDGLAAAPGDPQLLGLKGRVLLAMRDYPGALAAYESYLGSGVTGANQRQAQQIVNSLSAVRTTFVDIALPAGTATIYLDSRTLGVFCTAAPSCHKPILPGDYKVIAAQPGFDVWTGRLSVAAGATTRLAITMIEKPSRLIVNAPAGAQITLDGDAFDPAAAISAGTHHVVVSLAGHRTVRLDAVAHEGNPVTLDVALTPVTALRVQPATAALVLDGKPLAIEDGVVVLPPGDHTVVARAEGYVDRRIDVPADRPADYTIAIELDRAPPPRPPPPPAGLGPRRKFAVAVAGVGLAVTAAGVVLGVQSRSYKRDAFSLCPSPDVRCLHAAEANIDYSLGRSRAMQADVAFGVAGAAAITAAVLWFTGGPESRVAVAPQLGHATGVAAAVRF